MRKSITLEIEGIGAILFERSKRARHLNISVKPFKGVRVAVPYGISFKKAEKIVYSRVNWIIKHLDDVKRAERKYESLLSYSSEIDRVEAKNILIKRLEELTENNGFNYNKVFIRNQKTRWGSCSSKNNINLNIKLVKLPGELIDYVILHELVHTRIKNHSREFWAELDGHVGDAKKMDHKLKKYGIGFL